MTGERRDGERIPLLGNLPGEMMVYQRITIEEIGVAGAVIATTFPLHLDSLHDVRLTLGNCSLVVKGRVVHSSITDVEQETVVYRTGLEFVEPSAHVTAAIADYLTELKANRVAR